MKISNISFCGRYIEGFIPRSSNKELVSELRQARPFLRQIAYSMPKDKDLFVAIEKDEEGKQYIHTSCVERKNDNKLQSIAKTYGTSYSMGLLYTEKVFNGIKACYPELYPHVTQGFVSNLGRVDSEVQNSKYLSEDKAEIYNQIYP